MKEINRSELDCIVYDFDGVMTDNRVLVDENGRESVFVNRSDGYAVARIREMGIPQVIISTEENPVVERRAEKLKLEVIHGVRDKGSTVREYCTAHGYSLARTLFMGNDLNDLPAMRIVGLRAAPRDAEREILEIADWISEAKGGRGAVRDLLRALTQNEAGGTI